MSRILSLVFALVSVSAFAEEATPLFICSDITPDRIGIPEERPLLVVSVADAKKLHTIQIGGEEFLSQPAKFNVHIEATLADQDPGDAYCFKGETSKKEAIEMTITEDPKNGRIGLFAPTYTAKVTVGQGQEETWSCESPLDPQ